MSGIVHALLATRLSLTRTLAAAWLADDFLEHVATLRRWWRARLRRLVSRARQARQRMRLRSARRAERRLLEGLSDATLRDLGLTRGELGSVQAEAEGRVQATRRRVRQAVE